MPRRERIPRSRVGDSGAYGGSSRSFRGGVSQAASSASGSGASVLRGYLWKRGGGRSALGNKDWKQRWCVLVDGHFCYYSSQEAWKKAPGKCLKKPYQLLDCDILPGEHDNDFSEGQDVKLKNNKVISNSYAFRIQPRKENERCMILRCTDREQRSMWMQQLSRSVQFSESEGSHATIDRKGSSISAASVRDARFRGSFSDGSRDSDSRGLHGSLSEARRKSSFTSVGSGESASRAFYNSQLTSVEHYLQLANDVRQHEYLRQEDPLKDLIAHLRHMDRGIRLTAIRAFLRLARNQQNISAIIAHEGIEALLFMVSNTYPLIERQAITCAFQALRVLLFHEAANVLLAQNNIDDIVMSLALEFKSGASDLFDNLLLLLCDLVEARKLLKNTDVWVPHADLYDTFLFSIVNCGQDRIRARGFRALVGLLASHSRTRWSCLHDGDTNLVISACTESLGSPHVALVESAIDFLAYLVCVVDEPLFNRVQSVLEFIRPELERIVEGKASAFSKRSSRANIRKILSNDSRVKNSDVNHDCASHELLALQSRAHQLQQSYSRLTERMKRACGDSWRFSNVHMAEELLSMMIPAVAQPAIPFAN